MRRGFQAQAWLATLFVKVSDVLVDVRRAVPAAPTQEGTACSSRRSPRVPCEMVPKAVVDRGIMA